MLDAVLDFFFPPSCPFCGKLLKSMVPVCEECLSTLPFVPENCCSVCSVPIEEYSHPICAKCRSEKIYFEHSFVPLLYKDKARECVIALKTDHPYYAKGIAFLLAEKILSSDYYTEFDCVTFVPQSPKGKFNRGYNQSKLIARELSELLKLPCLPLLKRTNDGEDQHTLSASERKRNVRKCYFPTEKKGSGTVLLVDDIYTTGATANYCSYLLRKMGFDKVYLTTGFIRTND